MSRLISSEIDRFVTHRARLLTRYRRLWVDHEPSDVLCAVRVIGGLSCVPNRPWHGHLWSRDARIKFIHRVVVVAHRLGHGSVFTLGAYFFV